MKSSLPSVTRAVRALVIPLALIVQTLGATDPDFSRTPRAQVPAEFTWNVDDLFKDEAAWRAEFEAVRQRAETVDPLAKAWTSSPGAMADLLERVTKIQKRSRRERLPAGDVEEGRRRHDEARDPRSRLQGLRPVRG